MTSNFHFPNTRAPVCSVLVSSEPTAAQAPLPKKVLQSELHEGDLRVESLVANDSQILGKLTATNNIDLKEQVLVYGQTVSLKGSVQAVNSELNDVQAFGDIALQDTSASQLFSIKGKVNWKNTVDRKAHKIGADGDSYLKLVEAEYVEILSGGLTSENCTLKVVKAKNRIELINTNAGEVTSFGEIKAVGTNEESPKIEKACARDSATISGVKVSTLIIEISVGADAVLNLKGHSSIDHLIIRVLPLSDALMSNFLKSYSVGNGKLRS